MAKAWVEVSSPVIPGIDMFHFFEVIRLEKGKLFLQVGSGLYEVLIDVFEMLDI